MEKAIAMNQAPQHEHDPAALNSLTAFPINFETEDVVATVEELLEARGIAGKFSEIVEEAYEYEELGCREDGLEGHQVTIARMNHALSPHQWMLVEVVDPLGGDEHTVGAMRLGEAGTFREAMSARGCNAVEIPAVRWQAGDTFERS